MKVGKNAEAGRFSALSQLRLAMMPEVWIALDTAERRKNWRSVGYITAIFAGVAVAVMVSQEPGWPWWVISISGIWLVVAIHMVWRGYRRTLLAPEGIFINGPLRKRTIPWGEVAEVEMRHHTARSREWWDLRLVHISGRSVIVPGAFTGKIGDSKFDAKYALLREYWIQATKKD